MKGTVILLIVVVSLALLIHVRLMPGEPQGAPEQEPLINYSSAVELRQSISIKQGEDTQVFSPAKGQVFAIYTVSVSNLVNRSEEIIDVRIATQSANYTKAYIVDMVRYPGFRKYCNTLDLPLQLQAYGRRNGCFIFQLPDGINKTAELALLTKEQDYEGFYAK